MDTTEPDPGVAASAAPDARPGADRGAGRAPRWGDARRRHAGRGLQDGRRRAATRRGRRPASTLLGENRVQEAAAKVAEVPGARWHLVGPLQSNKARRALEVFEAIQSVDSVELAERLDRRLAGGRRRPPTARYPVLSAGQRRRRPGQGRLPPADCSRRSSVLG